MRPAAAMPRRRPPPVRPSGCCAVGKHRRVPRPRPCRLAHTTISDTESCIDGTGNHRAVKFPARRRARGGRGGAAQRIWRSGRCSRRSRRTPLSESPCLRRQRRDCRLIGGLLDRIPPAGPSPGPAQEARCSLGPGNRGPRAKLSRPRGEALGRSSRACRWDNGTRETELDSEAPQRERDRSSTNSAAAIPPGPPPPRHGRTMIVRNSRDSDAGGHPPESVAVSARRQDSGGFRARDRPGSGAPAAQPAPRRRPCGVFCGVWTRTRFQVRRRRVLAGATAAQWSRLAVLGPGHVITVMGIAEMTGGAASEPAGPTAGPAAGEGHGIRGCRRPALSRWGSESAAYLPCRWQVTRRWAASTPNQHCGTART